MTIERPWVKGSVYALVISTAFCVAGLAPGLSIAQTPPDSLTLQKPENVRVWRTYDASLNQFVVYVNWEEPPDSLSAYVHPPDTAGWNSGVSNLPDSVLTAPESGGWYTGDIDRTIAFKASAAGEVGQGLVPITYSIKREDTWGGTLHIGDGYTPDSWISILFRNSSFPDSILDLGFQVRFPPGQVDWQGEFVVGLEDFEGYHIWRGIMEDGSDLEVIGEISKQEAHWCGQRQCWMSQGSLHPAVIDLVYLNGFIVVDPFTEEADTIEAIIPSLRRTGFYDLGMSFEIVGWACLGSTISADLEDNEMIWFDCNAFNGFTYYYLVTTFDRGYNVLSQNQGLTKFDRCQPVQGFSLPDSCRDDLFAMPMEVGSQSDLKAVYAVPNPFRTGGSRITTSNYHNFPDDKVRFVNVPPRCTLKVFTVAGDLVWEIEHDGSDGNIEWDTRNQSREEVSSGVYIYKVEDTNGGQMYGRLIIIR